MLRIFYCCGTEDSSKSGSCLHIMVYIQRMLQTKKLSHHNRMPEKLSMVFFFLLLLLYMLQQHPDAAVDTCVVAQLRQSKLHILQRVERIGSIAFNDGLQQDTPGVG